MKFYHFFIVSLLGTLVACSSNEQQSENKTNTDNNVVTPTTQKINTSAGMKVYIDPKTGKFLDTAPKNSTPPKAQVIQSNNEFGLDEKKTPVYKEKQSTTPGGGTYIKMPPP